VPQQDDPIVDRRSRGALRPLSSEDLPRCQQARALSRVRADLRRNASRSLHIRSQGLKTRLSFAQSHLVLPESL
jgi:hypothetical protein